MAKKTVVKKVAPTESTDKSSQLERHHYALIAVITVVVMAVAIAIIAFIMASNANKVLDDAEQSNNVVPKITKPEKP